MVQAAASVANVAEAKIVVKRVLLPRRQRRLLMRGLGEMTVREGWTTKALAVAGLLSKDNIHQQHINRQNIVITCLARRKYNDHNFGQRHPHPIICLDCIFLHFFVRDVGLVHFLREVLCLFFSSGVNKTPYR